MRSIRQLLSAVLGTLVFAAMLFAGALFTAGPASAHDAAESSSPAQGATVATPPETVSVTFNKNPLGLGARFLVSDSAGTDWADGKVEIVDNVASQKLKDGAPAGAYTVTWHVVSSDSHPIEGTFKFTATAGANGSTPAGSTPAASVPGAGTAQPGTTAAPGKAPDASQPFPWSLVIFAAVAFGLLAVLAVTAKRRLAPGRDGADEEPLDGNPEMDDDAGTTRRRPQD